MAGKWSSTTTRGIGSGNACVFLKGLSVANNVLCCFHLYQLVVKSLVWYCPVMLFSLFIYLLFSVFLHPCCAFPFHWFIKALFNQCCRDTFITVISCDSFHWVGKSDSLNANVITKWESSRVGWAGSPVIHQSPLTFSCLSSRSGALHTSRGRRKCLCPLSAGWNQNINFVSETSNFTSKKKKDVSLIKWVKW